MSEYESPKWFSDAFKQQLHSCMAISSARRLKGSEFNWPLLRFRMIGWRVESIGAGVTTGQVTGSSTSFPGAGATISGKTAANVAADSLHGSGGHAHGRRRSTHDVTCDVGCRGFNPQQKQLELKGCQVR